MAKNYVPTLIVLLREVCKYIAKYRDTIVHAVGEDNAAKVDAIVTACNILMPILEGVVGTGV